MTKISHEQKKKLLFKHSKPLVRPFTDADLWVFWAAYKEGSFDGVPTDIDKETFYANTLESMKNYASILVIEDNNKRFKNGRGVVCFVTIKQEGCRIEPHVEFFKWATTKNILRSTVRFFNWIRYNRQIGACVVRCLSDTVNLFHRAKYYGVLFYVGKIVGGSPSGDGDEYIFSTKGKFVKE